MYLRRNKKNKNPAKKGQFDFSHREHQRARAAASLSAPEKEYARLPEPREMLIAEHSKDVLLHWQAPEFEMFERDKKWYAVVGFILVLIVGYAIFTNGLIMAITFILVGVVGYIYIHKEPRILNFMITPDGVAAGREIYEFKNIKSFWIFYEPEGTKVISLHTGSYLVPYVHIPIHDEDPVNIREVLLGYLPEEKHEPGAVETLDRLLRL
jgi:uncharacterized membrane protein